MVITGHSLYRLLWPDGARSGGTPSLYTSWVMPAALGFAEIEGELPIFHHGDFSKKCHTMVMLTTSRTAACGPLAHVSVQGPPSACLRKRRMCLVC
jgi:hypothetical protein